MKTTSKNLVFNLGLNDKDTKRQEISTSDAKTIVTNLACKYFWGASIHENEGVYTHENGEIVIERSFQIWTFTDKDYMQFVEDLKTIFNQESIMVTILSWAKTNFL